MKTPVETLIEWAHYTVNFWWGCTKVSDACKHCYAEAMARVFSRGKATWGPAGARWIRTEKALEKVVEIVEASRVLGQRSRVFINSMSDSFEANPALDTARCQMLVALEMFTSVDFLLLTKRPENVHRMVPPAWMQRWPSHIWIGTTVENQATADKRIPELLRIPAHVRFLSCEPLLGPVDLLYACFNGSDSFGSMDGINWVICGGESGHGARPMHPDWARSLRDQCVRAAVPFFFKQWGEWMARSQYLMPGNEPAAIALIKNPKSAVMRRDGRIDESLGDACSTNDSDSAIYRVGKKLAGRLLDGVEHNEFPTSPFQPSSVPH